MGAQYSPDASAFAVPYPAIAVSALPAQMDSMSVQTAAAASGVQAGAGYSLYPVAADGFAHIPTIAVRPQDGPSSTEDPELIASQQAAGMVAGLGMSAFKAVNSGVNLIADSVLLLENRLSFGLLQNTPLVQEANQQMRGLAKGLLHPFDTAEAMWQNEAGLAGAVSSRLATGDNFGAGLAAGEVSGDVAQLAVPALDAGKVGLVAAGRWVAPVAENVIQSYVQRTGVVLSAVPFGERMSAVVVDGATESVAAEGTRSPLLPPTDQPPLLTYTPTTNTLSQIRNMSGPARWQAAEQYGQELYGSSGQQYFPVPAGDFKGEQIVGSGGRYVDAPVPTEVAGTPGVLANEIKMYKQWTTVNGQPTQQFVPLSDQIQQQVLKDSWLQTNVAGYQPNWHFLDAPPSPELAQYLSSKGIPYVIYH